MTADVKIGDKWLEADFGFLFNNKSISPPEPNLIIIEIPGTSDVIDLTESISGDIEYKQRKITIKLESAHGKDSYFTKFSELANYIHGKKMKIIFNKDQGYYWIGRIAVTGAEPQFYGQTITITATVDPYKYETQSSMEPWIWDTFSLEDGIIRNYMNVAVPGTLTIIGRRKRVCPKFTCSGAMTVTYLGNVYNLDAGENLVPDIFLGEGEHVLTFGGAGTVNVDYRGASL
jgi:phage-related protein